METGIISLAVHIVLIVSLILSLRPSITKGGPPVYRVALRMIEPRNEFRPDPTYSPDVKIPIQKKEDKPLQEVNQKVPLFEKRNPDQDFAPSVQPRLAKVPSEEQKQPSQPEEELLKEPIPFPMAAASPPNVDLSPGVEDRFPTFLPPPRSGEEHQSTVTGKGSGNVAGQEGWGRGPGDGSGVGRGSSPGSEGFQKGARSGQGGSGWGSGDGSGVGRGGSGSGGSGNGELGVPHPRYAENPKPIYPQEARERGYRGEVLLRVEVLSNGRVGQIEVKKSSRYEALDQSALEAVKKWRFIPAQKGREPIPFWVNIPIKFELR